MRDGGVGNMAVTPRGKLRSLTQEPLYTVPVLPFPGSQICSYVQVYS